MKKHSIRTVLFMSVAAVSTGTVAVWAPASARVQDLPPGHPPIGQQMPPGHPPINGQLPPGHPPIDSAGAEVRIIPASPEDVATPEKIVSAYYDVVSGARGEARNWDRFRSLFIPEARMIAAQPVGSEVPCVVMNPEQFAQMNSVYFERGGYFERDIHRRIERFGNGAHVFSTYESRRAEDEANPYSRGVNSMQLVYDGERWWIASVLWDYERPDSPIPPEYLPAHQQ